MSEWVELLGVIAADAFLFVSTFKYLEIEERFSINVSKKLWAATMPFLMSLFTESSVFNLPSGFLATDNRGATSICFVKKSNKMMGDRSQLLLFHTTPMNKHKFEHEGSDVEHKHTSVPKLKTEFSGLEIVPP